MDSLCTAAAQALSAGDPLGALKRIALREDAPALALRGIAMAQLGELERAKKLLQRAVRAFGPREPLARARCEVARAEIALACRDPIATAGDRRLTAALRVLDARGDRANVLHGRLVIARRLLLLGRIDAADQGLATVDLEGAPPMLLALAHLAFAGIALRRIHTRDARAALDRARHAAAQAQIPALLAEVEHVEASARAPAALLAAAHGGAARALRLDEVEALLARDVIVVDGCRRAVRDPSRVVELATRPVLFSLARTLAEAWPEPATRDLLVTRAFQARRVDDSHRARLRVEIGRLRRELRSLADVRATPAGFVLAPTRARDVALLLPPIEGDGGALRALLADGEAWSTSALALAVGLSQRTVQRALSELETASFVRSFGRGRARRWVAPPRSAFATTLLLPTTLHVV